ncbi:hypothetical protein D3C72_1577120 [compost metagenome]
MLHQHDARREVGRQVAQQLRQRGRSARRGADDQQAPRARLGRRLGQRRQGRAAAIAADQPADVADLAQQRRGGAAHVAAAHDRRVRGVQRAVPHRVEHPRGMARHVRRHHHDRAGRFRHDAARGLDAVHDRHDEVHQHHVGTVARAMLHGLQSVRRCPRHFQAGLQRDRAPQGFDREGHIVDDPDSHVRAFPIRSSTASSSASSWKLPLAR